MGIAATYTQPSLSDLTFDEASHTYRVRGQVVPGVTSILRPLIDFSMVSPEVLARKADLGRRVHFACQLDDENDLDEYSVEQDVAPYLAAYRRFRTDTGAIVVANEQRVFEPHYRYAGTLDRLMLIGLQQWLLDLKTSFATPRSAGPQTAAYLRALNPSKPTRRGALRLRDDGTYRLDPLDGADDFSVFVACLTLHRFTEQK